MKKWQKERNYRRVKNEKGEIVANIITVDGIDVEVPEDVFLAYSQADRRERYITEEVEARKGAQLDELLENGTALGEVGVESEISAEDAVIRKENAMEHEKDLQILAEVLRALDDSDRLLIQALFWEGVSTRKYAQQLGLSQRAVIKRRDRILREMKRFFKFFQIRGIHHP